MFDVEICKLALLGNFFQKKKKKKTVCTMRKRTCNNNRICPRWSKFQRHLVLVFVYSQVVLIGKPLEHVSKGNTNVLYTVWGL